MKFKLKLYTDKSAFGNILPINYQYELSAIIYRILSYGDEKYSHWLHSNGFTRELKQFKFFNYSPLLVKSYKAVSDRLYIYSDTVDWYITFLPDKSTEAFIRGIFTDRVFQLGDKQSKVQFKVESIEALAPVEYQPEMTFQSVSPICIVRREPNGSNTYLSPIDKDAPNLILYSLKEKYQVWHNKPFTGDLSAYHFEVLDSPKPKLITLKAGTPEESKIKGHICRFKIRLSQELMEILFETGIGSKGSQGFGMVRIVK